MPDASRMKFPIESPQFKPRMLNLVAAGVTGVQEVTSIECVADVAGSLNDTYFLINTPSVNYYVWIDVDDGGTDPEVANRTGVEVDIAEDDTADDVATAVAAALDALSTMAAIAATDTVTVTNAADGAVTDAADGAVPTGFTIGVTTAGVTSGVALSMGKFDASIAETGAGPGDYTITFNEPFVKVPQVIVNCTTLMAPQLVSVSVSAVRVLLNNMSGNAADGDFHMLVIGSQASDSIL